MNYLSVFNDLMRRRVHAHCDCASCLYDRYKRSKQPAGRSMSKAAFFIFWLVLQLKEEQAKANRKKSPGESGTLTLFFWNGQALFSADHEIFRKTKIRKLELHKILSDIVKKFPEYESEFYPDVDTFLDYAIKDYIHRWEKNQRFMKILNRLRWGIYEEEKKAKADHEWLAWELGWRIYEFLRSIKEADRTQLLRRFSNKKAADLDEAINALHRHTAGAEILNRHEGKSVIYWAVRR